ncbi:DUF4190 domain-containing protein [Streptomyces sp. SID13031]|uniref:DUF4190 domain-containing protein n=1 Tax=Streptomyces sp. SID13031 TaxID=2706046 RepID=UPI0013C9FF68|nr:DUF4190 domain-containing protein [Streptomyces sp. SID13031]NEA33866.1 DUF4190 domain-containing protein [Streptomyces sp. SID13031]
MEPTPPDQNPEQPPPAGGGYPGPGQPAPGYPPAGQGGYPPPAPGQGVPPGYPPAGGAPPQGGYPPPPGHYPPPGQGGYPPPGQGAYPPPGQGGYPPPPGQGFYPYPGGNQLPPKGKVSVLAVLGFIFGLISIVPVSVVLSIIALVQIPKQNQRGRGLAIAGLVLSALWLVVYILAANNAGEPARDASGQVTTTVNTRPDKLRVGDCVTSLQAGEVKDIKVQPCDQPNGGKVFAVFDLPAGNWPGLAAVQAAAEKGCTDRFNALNQQADKPSVVFFLHPAEDGWSRGDHGTTCLIVPR